MASLNESEQTFHKNDQISLKASIIAINDSKNTFTIEIPATAGSNQPAKIIEIDQEYLSNCMNLELNVTNAVHNSSHSPSNNTHNISKSAIINKWDKLIKKANIDFNDKSVDPSNTMEMESSQECDAWFLRECPQTQRLCFILNTYKTWIEQQSIQLQPQNVHNSDEFLSISDLLSSLKGYSYKQLLNDFHHLKNFHINAKHNGTTDNIYDFFKKAMTESNKCHDTNCRSFSRNTRDRQKCRDATYRRELYFIRGRDRNGKEPVRKGDNVESAEIEEINVQELLDTIHAALIHYDFKEMSLSNKFVTHFEQKSAVLDDAIESKEQKSEEKKDIDEVKRTTMGGQGGEYGFGIAFKYTDKSSNSSYFCPKKYKDLKEELLQNNIYKLCLFDYESLVNKAEQFIISWNAKKTMMAKSMGTWNDNYKIRANSPAKCEHILVLMSYTNFDFLQQMFKKTYRKLYPNEHRKDVTVRHSEITNWASLLDQCLTFFSERLTDDGELFYHGINCQLKFTQFQAFFLCPTSTTTIPTIAYNFASERGVVIALSKADTRGPVFVNVSFLSDYPKEEERLIMCNNWSFNNIIYNGISTKYHVKCLKLFQKIINGSFIIHDRVLFQIKYQKTLIRMMDNYMTKVNDGNIPSYLQELFNHFCNNINTIWINVEQFKDYVIGLQKYLMDSSENALDNAGNQNKKSIFANKNKNKNIANDALKFGVFPLFLSQKFADKSIKLQKVSHIRWKIEGKQRDSFWRGKQIKGGDIICDITHLLMEQSLPNSNKKKKRKKNAKHNQFIFYPLCRQHTVEEDGRFKYGLKLESYPQHLIQSFTFRFEFSIPEIKFFDGETMETEGKGAVGDNRFESVKLKQLASFTVEVIISIRSASFRS